MKKSDWSKLSDASKTILERMDLNRKDMILEVGKEIDISYFNGYITENITKEIFDYQFSPENEGNFFVTKEDNKLKIHFIKSPW